MATNETPSEPLSYDLYESRGSSGLRRSGGFIYDERNPKLTGSQGARTYREMADNDPVIGGILHAFESLVRAVEWRVEPANASEPAKVWADFVDECRLDIDSGWQGTLSEVLSMLTFGWSLLEEVYKVRRGPRAVDPRFRSKFEDGRIGWRKLSIRSQESLLRWEYSADGELLGMWQQAQDVLVTAFIPIQKSLLFRFKAPRENPEGRSLLRNAYRPWFFAKRLEEIEGIGLERNLTGIPVFTVPASWLASTATPAQQALVAQLKEIAQQIKMNERTALVLPAPELTDEKGTTHKTGHSFSLASAAGTSRESSADVSIRRHHSRMAMSLLAEFLLLGMDAQGSFALADSKTNLFAVALGSVLDSIAEVFNRQAIPRLCELNGIPVELHPKLVHGDIENVDITAFASAITSLVTAGVLVPDEATERKVREVLGLPEAEFREAPMPKAAPVAPVVPPAKPEQ